MKEWIRERYLDLWHWWDYHFGHCCRYTLSGIAIYKGQPRRGGIPIVAWFYKCKCGREICEIDNAGVELLQQGVEYDELIKDRI